MRKLSQNFLMTNFMVILSWYQIIRKYHEVMLCQLKQQNFMGTDNSSDFLVINSSLLITKKGVSTTDRWCVFIFKLQSAMFIYAQ